jgi:hypothetical protein
MAGGWGSPWGTPWYSGVGGGSSALVPYLADVAIGGHGYRIDWSADQPLNYVGTDTLKPQSDQSSSSGEQSLNPEGYWRRSPVSWHHGAGQRHFDRLDPESDRNRFWQSQGIDFWDISSFKLLNDVTLELASANTNLRSVVVGDHLYWTNGTNIQYWTDVVAGAVNNITGEPATAASDITTNGFHVWTAHGADGIYRTTRGAATTASHITGTVEGIGFVRGRVLAFNNNVLYDVTTLAVGASGALPAALMTHGNSDWQWVDFAEGSGNIYLGGYSGDKSYIYRTAVTADGTALSAPIVAAELPHGEVITSMEGYLGRFILIGTDVGWRLAAVTTAGDLVLGALVRTTSSVLCFEGQAEFVWFGLTNFSATSTGLGRLSTAQFGDLDNLVPAYGSDLMTTGQGNVQSVVTFQGRRMYTVSGLGLYYENDDLVSQGYIDSGLINFNLTENKIGMFVNAQHSGEMGMHEVLVSVDEGSFVSLGTHDMNTVFNLGQAEGMNFEIRHILYRDAVELDQGLTVHTWTLRVHPKPEMTDFIFVTIFLTDNTESLMGTDLEYNTFEELDFIIGLYRNKDITTFDVANHSDSVIVDNYQMQLHEVGEGDDGHFGFNASCALKLKKAF